MSESVYPSSSYDRFRDNATPNIATTCTSRRQSMESLPLISPQFIEDLFKTESEASKQLDLKSGSVLDKSLESLIGLTSPISANTDKRKADQMFNYFLKKIKSEERWSSNNALEETARESVYLRRSAIKHDTVTLNSDETGCSTVCDIEEETMVSAHCSSESYCCSPGETPNYAATTIRRSNDPFHSKADETESQSNSSDWEPYGDPVRIEVVGQKDSSLTFRVFYSLIRHRASNIHVRVGESILLRDPNQQWFDRLPQVAEILDAYQDVPVEAPTAISTPHELRITLRRYYRSDQLLCVLPDIAIEITSREAVVFSSSHVEPFQPGTEFVGPCLLLSLNAFYRFWAEMTRLRNGRTKRRCLIPGEQLENWQDWLSTPERVFVICGEYDHISRVVDVGAETLLDLG